MRQLLARTQPLVRYEPQGDPAAWRAAEARLTGR
jgi:rhamnulokinase